MRMRSLQGVRGGNVWLSLVVAAWLTILGRGLVAPPLALAVEGGALETLDYTGRLRLDGALYTGEGLWKFAIVDATGKILWTNDGSLVLPPASGVVRKVAGGVVGIALGRPEVKGEAMRPIPSGIFSAPQTYLRAWVAVPTTAQPEELVTNETPVPHAQAFTSVPYSHRTARASQADEADHATRADQAATAAMANSLVPSAVGQPVQVHGDLVVQGKITSASTSDSTGPGKQGKVTFDSVTTRDLVVTGSVSLPGTVITSTVTQVQTLVVQTSATFVGPVSAAGGVSVGTGTILLGGTGTGAANTITFTNGAGTIETQGVDPLLFNPHNGGLVEIGRSVPGPRLRIRGPDFLNSLLRLEGTNAAGQLIGTWDMRVTPGIGFASADFRITQTGTADRLIMRSNGSFEFLGGVGSLSLATLSPLGDLTVTRNQAVSGDLAVSGRAGIGTTAPGARLHVRGPGAEPQLRFEEPSGFSFPYDIRLTPAEGWRVMQGGNDRITLGNDGTDMLEGRGALRIWRMEMNPDSDRLSVQSRDFSSPFTDLFRIEGPRGTVFFGGDLNFRGDLTAGINATLNVRDAQRRVGINVTAPEEMLHVSNGTVLVDQANALPAVLRMRTRPNGPPFTSAFRQEVRANGSWVVHDELAGQDRLTVDSAGDTKASGHLFAHGTVHAGNDIGDVAERFGTTETLSIGEAVVPSPAGDGQLTRATKPRDPGFIGVVSEGTGIVLAEKRNGPPIAMMGRVRAWLSAENGPITPGTPLTTASTPGHLMKADKSTPGNASVGVALGALSSGTGLVEIVLR